MVTSPATAKADSLIVLDDGKKYWEGVEASVSGMLGGQPSLSRIDLQGSRTFLARLGYGIKSGRKKVSRALEGGAGIGRVTEGLLLPMAERVDVIEPISKFTAALGDKPGVGNVYNVGLEGWQPAEGVQYDLIWVQWCAMYLPDNLLLEFLKRCKAALHPDGLIGFKENIGTVGEDVFDEEDSSVTREGEKFEALFEQAGLRLVRKDLQHGFPLIDGRPLYPVMMYALKP
ncbi:alpha-N-methyltransferase NTM1 [Thelonectria olida]|uniref:Alpha N-terminal protein methyltransferase 1 n=1 Tax=Thelonectria olida TaxID=1576542 RepID=A0A9P8VUA7_9HYPO|nr:alpha-N-methyltransferase NTM1 [Thelonectria olida]